MEKEQWKRANAWSGPLSSGRYLIITKRGGGYHGIVNGQDDRIIVDDPTNSGHKFIKGTRTITEYEKKHAGYRQIGFVGNFDVLSSAFTFSELDDHDKVVHQSLQITTYFQRGDYAFDLKEIETQGNLPINLDIGVVVEAINPKRMWLDQNGDWFQILRRKLLDRCIAYAREATFTELIGSITRKSPTTKHRSYKARTPNIKSISLIDWLMTTEFMAELESEIGVGLFSLQIVNIGPTYPDSAIAKALTATYEAELLGKADVIRSTKRGEAEAAENLAAAKALERYKEMADDDPEVFREILAYERAQAIARAIEKGGDNVVPILGGDLLGNRTSRSTRKPRKGK